MFHMWNLLILHELWAGERLSLEKAVPRYLRPRRPISVSAVPFGPGAGQEVRWVRGSGTGRKRFRLNRKTSAHLAGFRVQSRPRVWKRLRHVGLSTVFYS